MKKEDKKLYEITEPDLWLLRPREATKASEQIEKIKALNHEVGIFFSKFSGFFVIDKNQDLERYLSLHNKSHYFDSSKWM